MDGTFRSGTWAIMFRPSQIGARVGSYRTWLSQLWPQTMNGLLLTEGSLESMRFSGRREGVRWPAKTFVATVQYPLHFTTAHVMWASYASDDWIR
jgi:hypothetical protein